MLLKIDLLISIVIFEFVVLVSMVNPQAPGLQSEVPSNDSELIARYESPTSLFRIQEDLIDLRLRIGKRPPIILLRFCSARSLDSVLLFATLDPFETASYLVKNQGVDANNIIFERSGNCGKSKTTDGLAPSEIWLLNRPDSVRASEEHIAFSKIKLKAFGFDPLSCKKANFNLKSIVREVRKHSDAFLVIIGYYLHKPSTQLTDRIKLIERELQKWQIPSSLYRTGNVSWHFGTSGCSEIEPTVPSVFIVQKKH